MDHLGLFVDAVTAEPDDDTLLRGASIIAGRGRGADAGPLIHAGIEYLAGEVPGDPATPEDVLEHLFTTREFSGNSDRYYDPANSYLDVVIARKVGIPISLAVLAIEVARRVGVTLTGVGMPGHFLLGVAGAERWFDPFAGGAALTRATCEARFLATQPAGAVFEEHFLDVVGPGAILGRMLTNLHLIGQRTKDRDLAAWTAQFRSRLPGVPAELHRSAARALADAGRFDEAAAALETLADLATPEVALAETEKLRQLAQQLRARLN